MEKKEEGVRLSRKWKLFQLYSLQIALGCLSGFIVLNLSQVEKVFIRIDLVVLYAYFVAIIIFVGTLAFICSGGIGLFRLINAKKLLHMIEKEENERI